MQLQLCSLTLTPVGAISFTLQQFCPRAKSLRTHWVGLRTSLDIFEVDTNLCSLSKIEPRSFRDHCRLPVGLFLLPNHAHVTTKAVAGINSDPSYIPLHLPIRNIQHTERWPIGRMLLTSIVTNNHACSPCPQLSGRLRFRVPSLETDASGVSVQTAPPQPKHEPNWWYGISPALGPRINLSH